MPAYTQSEPLVGFLPPTHTSQPHLSTILVLNRLLSSAVYFSFSLTFLSTTSPESSDQNLENNSSSLNNRREENLGQIWSVKSEDIALIDIMPCQNHTPPDSQVSRMICDSERSCSATILHASTWNTFINSSWTLLNSSQRSFRISLIAQPVNQYGTGNLSTGRAHTHSRSIREVIFQSVSTKMLLAWKSSSWRKDGQVGERMARFVDLAVYNGVQAFEVTVSRPSHDDSPYRRRPYLDRLRSDCHES